MPTYSYACTECDNRFDAQQAFTDDALTTCPQCSGRLRKLFNSVGVVFKGSGFYRTANATSRTSTVPAGTGGAASSGNSDSGTSTSSDSGSSTSGTGSSGESSSTPAPAAASASTAL